MSKRAVIPGERASRERDTPYPIRFFYYWRQLKDMKGTLAIEQTTPSGLVFYGGVCGRALARAHARSGDSVQIAAYLGKSDVFDQAIVQFAEAYANQTERDYQALVEAAKAGRIVVPSLSPGTEFAAP